MRTNELFSLDETICKCIFENTKYPWEVLSKIKEFIIKLGPTLDKNIFLEATDGVWIAKSAKVMKSAHITAPAIIDEEAEIRHCAFLRGSVIVGKGAVVGNSCEVKNSILFNRVQIPHYNYVGDSVLGYGSHLGAGAITSNVKSDKSLVTIKTENEKIETGLKKFGAIVGDFCEVGCNSVLCPGTVLGKNTTVYPLSMVRGEIPKNSIFKSEKNIIPKNITL